MEGIKKDLIILLFFLTLSIALMFNHFGMPDWDFYSYHYYNGFAFLNNRIDIDLMASHVRNYFNPILDSFNYIFIKIFNNHPLIHLILDNLKYGIILFLGYKIADLVFKNNSNKFEYWFKIVFCTILSAITPVLLGGLTIGMVDIYIAILVLLSLYILLKYLFCDKDKKNLFNISTSGLILGISFGLKYTSIAYIITLPLIILLMKKDIQKPLKTFGYLILGIFGGFLLSNGTWSITLLQKFHNPFFPYFDNIFHSPFGNGDMILNNDFAHLRPNNILELLFYPLKDSFHFRYAGAEFKYFDIKSQLGFISIVLCFILLIKDAFKLHVQKIIDLKIFYLLLYFVSFSYLINTFIFGNIRYIIASYIIVPIIIYVFLAIISNKESFNYLLSLVLCIAIFGTMNFNHKPAPWLRPKQVLTIENIDIKDYSTVLCGTFASCFFAPNQNPTAKYIGYVFLEKDIAKGVWADDRFKYKYFKNKYLETHLKEIFENSKDLYFTYTEPALGRYGKDMDLINNSINYYSEGKISKIRNCKSIFYSIYGYPYTNKKHYICKLK